MRKRHKQLEKDGWLRQFLADEVLAKDAVEIYDLLGYEVYLHSLNRAHYKKCNSSSPTSSQGQCRIVYIKPKKSPDNGEE